MREYAAKEVTFGIGAHVGMLWCVNELANAVKVTMCGAKGGAAAAAPWWRLPVEVLLLWATRAARSAWSVPVAIALLGIAVRGRRMRRQSKAVARLRLVLDDKQVGGGGMPTRGGAGDWIRSSSSRGGGGERAFGYQLGDRRVGDSVT
ncbi:uncharacterized protein [Triticum aestivum]|uniref:uncharacterized protein isoform X9 n=1 Tax=Triticum aestivum TaxID=4565 RepID=UPI001D015291|nr:uncharacterized protein LOC123112540 isoform X9 [Triticum aestivum]